MWILIYSFSGTYYVWVACGRASERRARLKITPREKGEKRETPRLAFLAMGDFHARSRFARSTIPKEKRGLLVVYFFVYVYTSPREFITNGVTL